MELEPARLGGQGAEQEAGPLVDAFDSLLELPSVVAFIDEVEGIASMRQQDRRVSSEPDQRAAPPVRSPAFATRASTCWCAPRTGSGGWTLRSCGPAGSTTSWPSARPTPRRARRSGSGTSTRSPTRTSTSRRLSRQPDLYTPADIEFAARKAAQLAFEREHFEHSGPRAKTDDFLIAIRQTRPSLARDIIDGFEGDQKKFARY